MEAVLAVIVSLPAFALWLRFRTPKDDTPFEGQVQDLIARAQWEQLELLLDLSGHKMTRRLRKVCKKYLKKARREVEESRRQEWLRYQNP